MTKLDVDLVDACTDTEVVDFVEVAVLDEFVDNSNVKVDFIVAVAALDVEVDIIVVTA